MFFNVRVEFRTILYIMQLHVIHVLILILIYFMLKGTEQVLQRKYVALVMGTPRHPKGLLSAPLAKVC